MIRVGDLDKSIDFYINSLDMTLIKRKDYPEGKFTLVFVGYGTEEDSALIELTYNWGTNKYDLGNAFGHVAIGVEDIYACCKKVISNGGKVTREPNPMKFGGGRNIAFIEDPDGYKIELIENK
ncbi:MAG: lactoylglutathione lyase [Proteobacteria bacterium]|jgi:lactoylglutathione lyase|nr:lactoylglutathione lyase [Pseudomonadota bacterium]